MASARVKIEGDNKVHVHNIGEASATCGARTSGDTMFLSQGPMSAIGGPPQSPRMTSPKKPQKPNQNAKGATNLLQIRW
jgi:hypothetical protein